MPRRAATPTSSESRSAAVTPMSRSSTRCAARHPRPPVAAARIEFFSLGDASRGGRSVAARAASCGRLPPASDRTAHVRRKSRARAPSRAVLIPCRPPCGRAQVIEVDLEWRQLQFKVDNLRADYGKVNKEVAAKKKAKEDADDLIAKAKGIDADIKVAAGWRACILFPHSHQRTARGASGAAPGRDLL